MNRLLSLTLAIAAFFLSSTAAQAQQLIGYWDFDNGFDLRDEDAAGEPIFPPQLAHSAPVGSGVIYQQRAEIDGNGKGGNAYANALFGINSDGDRSIAWDDIARSGSDDDGELFIEFSTAGFQDIQISFDVEWDVDDDPTEFNEYDIRYSNNPLVDVISPADGVSLIKDFTDGVSIDFANNLFVPTTDGEFTRTTIDLTGAPGVDNQLSFALRLDDFDGGDDVRFDNFLVTGTAIGVPEPSSLALALSGFVASMLRRRRTK